MFFLLRMAFWLMVVFALLPLTKSPDDDKHPQVAATDAVSAATAAVSDMAQFCTRQPTACEIGGQAASVVTYRAQAGAKKVYEFITEKTEKKSPELSEKKPPETVAVKETIARDLNGRQDIRPAKDNTGHTGKAAKKAPDHTGSIGPAIAHVGVPLVGHALGDLKAEWQAPILQ
ncbi:MAG: DUF5330 domain-containing protein [Afipia sp.]|nr:DUF5330 domain-containing protein [Afipia sp.]